MERGPRCYPAYEETVNREDAEGQLREAVLYIEELEEALDDSEATAHWLDSKLYHSERKRQSLIDCLPILVAVNILLILWNLGAGYYGFAVGFGLLAVFVGFCWWAAEEL